MTDLQLYKGFDSNLVIDRDMMRKVYQRFVAPLSPSSRTTFRYALRQIAKGLGLDAINQDVETLPWYQVTADSFSDLILGMQGVLEPSTIRLYMHALRGICRACYISGLMPASQFMLIKEVKLPKGQNRIGRGRSVARTHSDALLKCCIEDERIQGIRDAALIAVLFGTGMRRAEAASIDVEAMNLDEGEIRVRTKGNNLDIKYVQAWAIPLIHEWLQVRRSEGLYGGAFFTSIQKNGKVTTKRITGRGILYLLERRSKMAGIPFIVRPHDARRTMGTQMIEEHGELVAQRVLKHANLSTTRIYDKRDDSMVKSIFKDKH
ncbi:hypothetical protein LCGC14_0328250 [marine sediment metagenome]|uniref:Tyr recombinase domain-containing protein n=1 Tax=marine sediment metagenome TaxID=412755 RepID=A0A0F9W4M0_9ZZZZ